MRLVSTDHRRRRSGITEFVVVVFLILVSLITGAILGSIVFGGIAAYASPAEVSAQVASCESSGPAEACRLTLTNIGATSVSTDGSCAMGSQQTGTVVNGGVIPAGGSLNGVECVVGGVTSTGGSHITGAVSLTNGFEVYFAGSQS